ncbi:MAG: hypothetical protein ABW217_09460 [Polyangiaceae bacterium]
MRATSAAAQAQPTQAPTDMMGMMDTPAQEPGVNGVNGVANLATSCADNTAAPLSVSEAQQLMATFERCRARACS